MKYTIILYIALGLTLSLTIGIKYNCEGPEMFPTYYGSPFVFMEKSLASSMEYYYNFVGLIGNIFIWGITLFLIDKVIQMNYFKLNKFKIILFSYKILIGLLIVFSTLSIRVAYLTGRGFTQRLNYWNWNLDKEAMEWGMACQGEIIFLNE